MNVRILAPLLSAALFAFAAPAEADETWRLDAGISFSRFEQQVKSEIGGLAGERLVEETELGLAAMGTWRVWGPLALGLYLQYDVGSRSAGHLDHFDDEGKPTIQDETGGSFQEFWAGPMVRAQWRTLFVEVAYGALGVRLDEARKDLPDVAGNTDSALLTSPSIAWLLALGGGVPITDVLELVIRLEYRVRYYDRRSNGALNDEVVHGTQNFTPFVGVAWTP
jgi:hypothetical protein